LQAMRAHGIEPDSESVFFCEDFSEEAGNVATRAILDKTPGVTAFITATDLLALGCYDALEQRGIQCPKGVSVVGYNDMPFVDKFNPPLTTVRIPLEEMGRLAAEAMLSLMREATTQVESVMLRPELVIRGSTAPVRG